MDQSTQFSFSNKTIIPILLTLTISIVFFLFSNSSCFPFLPQTFSIKLFSYSTDRNYIFLLCNGILVFLIKNSGLIANSASGTDFKDNNRVGFHRSIPEISETKAVVAEAAMEVEGGEKMKNEILVTVREGEENESGKESDFLEEEEEDEEGIEAEELKKKFDDFIKKMKEGIKIEAQQVTLV